jgi:AbrB family looped-hinge helix DNA binding protein
LSHELLVLVDELPVFAMDCGDQAGTRARRPLSANVDEQKGSFVRTEFFTIFYGRINTMKTTIDGAGRVVVPKALRQAIGLRPGSEVEMRVSDGRIEMEPAPLEVRTERRGGLLVAVPSAPLPPMAASAVDETVASLRTSRSDQTRKRR